MSFPLDIDELFNGDLSQYDSNDFSEMNSVFQRDFNRSPSLDRSNMEQQLTLTSFSANKKEKENEKEKNKKNINEKNDLDEDLRKRFQLLTTDMEITDNVTNKQNNKNKIETEKENEEENVKEKENQNQQQMEQEKEQPKKKENEIDIEQTNERSLYQRQKQQQQQKPNKFNNFELLENDNVNGEDNSEVQTGKSKYGRNIQSKFRKRDFKKPTQNPRNKIDPNNMIRENSTIVESGKEVYKLLVGVLWVMSGGASIKTLTPFSDTITKKIGELLNASETEETNFKKQLKYLLTNSRRTFTEYILEILIGILSLRFVSESEEESDISVQFWDTLTEIVEIDLELKKIGQNQNQNSNENETNENERMNKIKKKEELHSNLQKIYHKVFTPKILMFWFNKRFIDRLDAFFGPSLADKFYKEHFCYFGKSKFMLSCLILAGELIKQDGIAKRYSELIDLEYESDPLNLYSNNRGKKQGLIKELIVKYQLNGGQYWKVLSREYMKQIKFNDSNVFDFFPFKEIIGNPLFTSLCGGHGQQMLTQKKRVLATKGNVIENVFNIGWIMKKEN
ncbi:hypothetical protein M0812_11772 [Anaeramoeba flamelloides]|uniref:Uncharacterized protein n=1 Tax=Anaeramoeba flamelloides TaxID=1746091 RepID=A0AAV8A125_9EUKA|nr:hypothetical protein M0812_11772 [Anaeramoeba flamelloides]